MAIYTQSTVTANTKLVYRLRDHLGSLQYVVNEAGTTVLEEYSYDAWGCRRDPVTWKPAAITANTARGFTGHEHIDLFELVNMDGRVYDPRLGRFMSPDPYVQAPFNSQRPALSVKSLFFFNLPLNAIVQIGLIKPFY